MVFSQLYCLEDLLENGIIIRDDNDSAKKEKKDIESVLVPRLQRSYAQGRKSESKIRNGILRSIFDVLKDETGNRIQEFSFIYGSYNSEKKFELLDGQQRLTTMFLVHWYVYQQETGCCPICLNKFSYETRQTSNVFLRNIVSLKNVLGDGERPSICISKLKWFTEEFWCDPTVRSMLVMLDEIHKFYHKKELKEVFCLANNLKNLKFYVLLLDRFSLSEELYIKMNARGLPLTPFENFKADLINYIRRNVKEFSCVKDEFGREIPYEMNISTKFDAKWIDIFWKAPYEKGKMASVYEMDDRKYSIDFLRLITRYFAIKRIISGFEDDQTDNDEFDPLSLEKKNYNVFVEEYEKKNRYWGFKAYRNIMQKSALKSLHVKNIEKFLDIYRNNQSLINSAFNDSFCTSGALELWCDYDSLSYPRLTAMSAIFSFLDSVDSSEDFEKKDIQVNFKRYMRVVWNIIENTQIESLKPAISVVLLFNALASAKNATTDFYKSMVGYPLDNGNRQYKEELVKAREIVEHPEDTEWESVFIKCEHHPFFKGMVGFFFESNFGSSSDFWKRYQLMVTLFDENGITADYKKDHILMRAILSTMSTWDDPDGMHDQFVVEKNESNKHLKNILAGNSRTQEMIKRFFRQTMNIKDYLNSVIDAAKPGETETDAFKLAFKRLVNDERSVALLDYIEKGNKGKKIYVIKNESDNIMIHIPNSWYDRFFIGCERGMVITQIKEDFQFEIKDHDKIDKSAEIGDYADRSIILLMNDVNGEEDALIFATNNNVYLCSKKQKSDSAGYRDGYFVYDSCRCQFFSEYENVKGMLYKYGYKMKNE